MAQASTTSGQSGSLTFGAVTTAAPTYTTGTSNNLSLTTAGALRTDSSATTQPVSIAGTVAVSGPLTDTQLRAAAVPVSGTITANPVLGSITQASGTAGATSTTALASNAARKYLLIQNHSARNMWFSFTGPATTAKPSLKLIAGTSFVMEGVYVSTQAVTTIREGGNDADFTIVEGT